MWKKATLLILTGLFVTSCSFTPIQLNGDPARYNGRAVVLRGFVSLAPDRHVLCESRAIYAEVQKGWEFGNPSCGGKKYDKYCVTIANSELLYKNRAAVNARTITLQGKFIDSDRIVKTFDLGACPLPTAIIIDNAALAQRYPSIVLQK
jgi:hypothetical protein